ncbi:MAG: sigma-54-dependent Fis family transcriptional regulator [Deltaproteobacteria bacterium]|nr:MAG: sigma-54-dependent Fis family transcriptional regulator [Deltaproteobacteria bacterium]
MEQILIMDDDDGLISFLSRFFQRKGYAVTACSDSRHVLDHLGCTGFDLIMLDCRMPDVDGLETLSAIQEMEIRTPVILMTAHGTTELAIEAMKRGAYDYLVKPFERNALSRIVAEALQVNRQMKETVRLPAPSPAAPVMQGENDLQIIGNSRKMHEIFKRIGQVAETDVPVLITGESGTGKELAARAIYHHSRRKEKPFLAVNCAAIPETLFESELFGHERGSFTGADRTHIGKVERCRNGTLFLDEIGEMPVPLQAKLLRVLQEGEIERVGGSTAVKVNVRVIAATNKDLEKAVEAGEFRPDLYWRLNVISLHLPPLAERSEDIPELVNYFRKRFALEYGQPVCHISEGAMARLRSCAWPGNVRELENCIRRAVLLSTGNLIAEGNLLIPDPPSQPVPDAVSPDHAMRRLNAALESVVPDILRLPGPDLHARVIDVVEAVLIRQALNACGGNQVHAARMLGISRNTLRHRLKKQQDTE